MSGKGCYCVFNVKEIVLSLGGSQGMFQTHICGNSGESWKILNYIMIHLYSVLNWGCGRKEKNLQKNVPTMNITKLVTSYFSVLQKIFAEHDKDSSGSIDMFELTAALGKQGYVNIV